MAVGSSLVPSSQSLLGGLSLTTHVFILGTLLALVLPILFVLYKILSFLFRILQRLGRLGSWIIGRRERLAPADSAAALSRQTTGAENVDDSAASKGNKGPKGKSIAQLLKETREMNKSAAAASDEKAQTDPHFLAVLKNHGGTVTSVRWSPVGTWVATACDDGRARRFDLTEFLKDAVAAAAAAPSARSLAPASERKVMGANLRGALIGPNPNQTIALMHDGDATTSLVSLTGGSSSTSWEVGAVFGSSKEQLGKFLVGGFPLDGDVKGQAVVCAGAEGTKIAVYSAATGKELARVDTSQVRNHCLAGTRDGRFFAAGAWTSDVKVFENKFHVEHGGVGMARHQFTAKAFDLSGHKQGVTAVAFSFELPQPKRAVTVCKDGSIGLWNTDIRYIMKEDAKMIKQGFSELPGKKPYAFVALSPGPDYVIAAGSDSLVHFFDAATMRLIGAIPFAHQRLTDLQFCPELDGRGRALLATAGTDKRARIWAAPNASHG